MNHFLKHLKAPLKGYEKFSFFPEIGGKIAASLLADELDYSNHRKATDSIEVMSERLQALARLLKLCSNESESAATMCITLSFAAIDSCLDALVDCLLTVSSTIESAFNSAAEIDVKRAAAGVDALLNSSKTICTLTKCGGCINEHHEKLIGVLTLALSIAFDCKTTLSTRLQLTASDMCGACASATTARHVLLTSVIKLWTEEARQSSAPLTFCTQQNERVVLSELNLLASRNEGRFAACLLDLCRISAVMKRRETCAAKSRWLLSPRFMLDFVLFRVFGGYADPFLTLLSSEADFLEWFVNILHLIRSEGRSDCRGIGRTINALRAIAQSISTSLDTSFVPLLKSIARAIASLSKTIK